MEHKNRNKSRKGFTLVEVLAVVAVLAVVLAFGVPAIIGGFRSIRLTELDESARSIFLAAQNRMTAMLANGELEKFAEGPTGSVAGTVSPIPTDFPKNAAGDPDPAHGKPDDLRYLDSTDPAHENDLKQLLPGGSIQTELAKNHYVVEYNCKTGAIYGVWYSDEEFTYDGEPRLFNERLKEDTLVGYYGGSGVDYAEVGQLPVPEVILTNAEELRLTVKIPLDSPNVQVDVTMTGATSHATATILKGASLGPDSTGTVMLDTLKNYPAPTSGVAWGTIYGQAFKNWAAENGKSFIPGEDITVTVKTYYAGGDDKLYLPREVTVSGNSLFAPVTETAGVKTAQIAYGRHLQNLDTETSGVDASITKAEQVQEIDFSDSAATGIYSWADTYPDYTGIKRFKSIVNENLKSYNGNSLPIRHLTTTHSTIGGLFKTLTGTVDGKISLQSIVLVDTSCVGGALAGRLTYANITNCQVYLVDNTHPYDEDDYPTPETQITSGGPAGGLVGSITNCTITDSFASTVIHSDAAAGGLVGEVFGAASKIERSYAASYIDCSGVAGGLVGRVNATTTDPLITNSYAAGIIANASGNAGGLVGGADTGVTTVTINDSYAAVRYGEKVVKASFDISSDKVTVYGAAKDVTAAAPAPGATPASSNVYYIPQTGVKYEKDSGTAVTSTQLSAMAQTGAASGLGSDWYNPAGTTTNPKYATFPYHQTKETENLTTPYPYPMLKANGTDNPMLHYGDWLKETEVDWCYFEKYEDGATLQYGIWGYLNDGIGRTIPINTGLKLGHPDKSADTELEYAVADGYGFLVKRDAAGNSECPEDIAVPGGTLKPVKDATSGDPVKIENVLSYRMDGEEIIFDLYPYFFVIDKNAAGEPVDNQYYHSLYLFNQEYWFNTDYACEAVKASGTDDIKVAGPQAKPGAGGFGTGGTGVPNQYSGQAVIRTARQLANLAKNTGSEGINTPAAGGLSAEQQAKQAAQLLDYVQLLDIDYSKYTGIADGHVVVDASGDGVIDDDDDGGFTTGKSSTSGGTPQSPAALSDSSTDTGSYDGSEFIIRNLYIQEATDGTGLFGRTQGTLSNIRLVNVSVSGGSGVGALAGHFEGTDSIENCGVYVDALVPVTDTNYKDTIEKNYGEYSIKGTGDNVGGLIGSLQGAGLTNCFAAVKVSTDGSTAGGLVGLVGGNCALENCYSGGHTVNGKYADDSVNVTGANNVGGLIGQIDGSGVVTFTGVNYSTCSVGASDTAAALGKLIGAAAGTVNPSTAPGDVCYALGKTFQKDASGNYVSTPARDETTYLSAARKLTTVDTVTDYPYDVELFDPTSKEALAYPYQTGTIPNSTGPTAPGTPMPHHGDWVEGGIATSFYWEKEGTDYHFYLVLSDGKNQYVASDLCTTHNDNKSIGNDTWGYGLIGIDAGSLTPYTGTGTEVTDIENGIRDFAKNESAFVGSGSGFDVAYEALKELLDAGATITLLAPATTDDFHAIETDAGWLELNLGFAAAIDVKADDGTGTPDKATNMGTNESHAYQIRNVRQLDNIPDTGDATTGVYYKQTHDVYGGADNTPADYTGYTGAENFGGHYDGQSYRILELNMTNGLFTSLSGGASLDSIILYSRSGTAAVNGNADAVGGLAGSVTGSGTTAINNCVVAGYTLTNSNSTDGRLGGLVGRVESGVTLSITGCEAVNMLSGRYSGGLLGDALGTVNITNSYAGGKFASGSGQFGGIVGTDTGATLNYTNVYSYMDFSNIAAPGNNKYAIGPTGTYNNCYYWKDGITGAILDGSNANVAGKTLKELKELRLSGFGEADETHTWFAPDYWGTDRTTDNKEYPYPAVVKDNTDTCVHYGDWPVEEAVVPSSLCYYELVGGTYGLWGYLDNPTTGVPPTPVNTLKSGHGQFATDDGYGVLVESGKVPATDCVKVDGTTYKLPESPTKADAYEVGGKKYDLYKITGLDNVAKTSYYTQVTLGDGAAATNYWFNPFFACEVQTATATTPGKKTGAAGDGSTLPASDYDGQVVIRTARQLVWLGELTKGVNADGDATDSSNPYFYYTYNQLLDINYSTYTGNYGATFNGKNNASGNLQQPINLLSRNNNPGKYIGGIIKNLKMDIPATSDNINAGLFGVVKGEVSGVRLVDATVKTNVDDSDVSVGGLIGETMGSGSKVTNCGIYLVDGDYDTYVVEAVVQGDVGGLIGNIGQHTVVENCFAAVKVKGPGKVGGFAGLTKSDVTITNCYSGGHTVDGAYSPTDANVTSSGSNAGGLIGQLGDSNTFTGVCYSTCSVSGNSNVGALIGRADNAPTTTGATLYATGTAIGGGTLRNEETYLETDLSNVEATHDATFATHPYDDALFESTGAAKEYPYQTGQTEHYGDWPKPPIGACGLAYVQVEQTATGGNQVTYHVVGMDADGNVLPEAGYNTLSNDAETHVIASYFATFTAGTGAPEISGYTTYPAGLGLPSGTDTNASNAKSELENALKAALSNQSVTVELYRYDTSSSDEQGTITVSTTAGATEYIHYAPGYSNISIDAVNTDAFGAETNPFEIRSAGQLDNIPNDSNDCYKQVHDLYGDGYSSTYTGATGFAGTYNGQGYRILNLSMTNGGMFSSLGGTTETTIESVILYSNDANSHATISGTHVGGIAGTVSAGTVKITNCAVAGYSMSGTDVGGLVGTVLGGTLRIEKCEAVNNLGGTNVGGLVGNHSSGTLTINYSYAGGKITGSATSVGGIVGAGYANYIRVYSYMDMTNATAPTYYGIGAKGTAALYTRENCKYLKTGFLSTQTPTDDPSLNSEGATTYSLGTCMNGVSEFGKASADHTFRPSGTSDAYLYPAVVRMVTVNSDGTTTYGDYVHYGDW